MTPRKDVDLTRYSFEDFVGFLFDREVSPKLNDVPEWERDWWYSELDDTFVAETICAYYIRLFHEPEFLLKRFSKAQLEAGFWAIQSPLLNCSIPNLLLDSDLPIAMREQCARSMVDLFKRLFAIEGLDTSVHMWWDSLCYDWHCGNRNRERGGDDRQFQDIFFQVLEETLAIDSERCQAAALHGLGHLHHPNTEGLIKRYIERNPSLSDDLKAYALSAAKFDIM